MENKKIKKPNFFIIGAPKCGTTSLSKYLEIHPNIFFSDPKEPHYFCTDFSNEARRYITKKAYLKKCFTGSQGHKRVGEGSTLYLYSSVAVPNILKFNPQAKFIIMIRNPVELVYSWHSQALLNLDENVKDFKKAWQLQNKRKNCKAIPSTCRDPKLLLYGEIGKLGKQIKKLLNTAPKKNIKIIKFYNFTNNTKGVYKDVLDFLDLQNDDRKDFPVYHKNTKLRIMLLHKILSYFSRNKTKRLSENIKEKLGIKYWPPLAQLSTWNKQKKEKDPLDENFRRELKKYFEDDQKLLEKIIRNHK